MAPLRQEIGNIKVSTASLTGLPDTNYTVAQALRAFFESSLPQDPETFKPPLKRRKLVDNGHGVSDPSSIRGSSSEHLCLLDLVLYLNGTPGDGPALEYDSSPQISVPVQIDFLSTSGNTSDGSFTIGLKSSAGSRKKPSIILGCPSCSSSELTKTLMELSPQANRKRVDFGHSCQIFLRKHNASDRPGYAIHARLLWSLNNASRVNLTNVAFQASGAEDIWTRYLPASSRSIAAEAAARAARATSRRHGYIGPQWSVADFYASVHVPSTDQKDGAGLCLSGLQCEMFPFQKRAVQWMVQQETHWLQSEDEGYTHRLPPSFEELRLEDGTKYFASHLLASVNTLDSLKWYYPENLRGGILAEEMGLGKTVELISLILHHQQRKKVGEPIHDTYTDTDVITSKATMIVMPPSLLRQWQTELKMHAPALQAFVYPGVKKWKGSEEDVLNRLTHSDVVLCPYNTLSSEIHYADEKPSRALRGTKRYEPKVSPLIKVCFWRVCLDEAQMIEGGASQAATVARRIPRINQWAVSGTPLRKDVTDLQYLFGFLRYEPFASTDIFNFMLREHPSVMTDIVGRMTLRHTKAQVRQELQLPPQRRIVIAMPFTAIEEQNYNNLFRMMCDEVGCDETGSPNHEDWDPEDKSTIEIMRRWLTRLRQTCLHPEVGGRNRRALGRNDGPLRTVDEVLSVMLEQNETELRSEERATVLARVLQGHLKSFGKDPHGALELYSSAMQESAKYVEECRENLALEKRNSVIAKSELGVSTGEGYEEQYDTEDELNQDARGRLQAHQQRLRSAIEVNHICVFFTATAYFQIKELHSMVRWDSLEEWCRFDKIESDLYEQAKLIRRELLTDATAKAKRAMSKVETIKSNSLAKVTQVAECKHGPGIESRKLIDKFEDLRELLNEQAEMLEEWRQQLHDLLLTKLLDQDDGDDLSGKEYEATTQQEDTMYAYIDGLRALIADRHCYLTGQVNPLVNEEMKTLTLLSRAGEGHAPELMKVILSKRDTVKPNFQDPISLRGLISEARSIVTAVQWQEGRSNRAAVEGETLNAEIKKYQGILTTQMKILTLLEKERDTYRATMNARLDFYKQVQQISDTVVPLDEEPTETVDIARLTKAKAEENKHAQKVSSFRTKARFLQHLQADASGQDTQRTCVICQSTFSNGVLTVCGHVYCTDCIRMWYREHRNCPMCKRKLTLKDFHPVTFRPRELQIQEESGAMSRGPADTSPSKTRLSGSELYSTISQETLNEIKEMNIRGSFGTKIDTLCRHLLWLRQSEPGSKAIVFSQYSDFLQVLGQAFKTQKIEYTQMGDSSDSVTSFKENPLIQCFLLSAKSNASGLNLVNATHVFLCEPLINPAIELQAIARVHRIGQHKLTTVWMYIVNDSVEETVYDISVTRRLEHIQKVGNGTNLAAAADLEASETAIEAANSSELQNTSTKQLLTYGKSGGEMVAKEDLWSCLFGAARSRRSEDALEAEGLLGEVVGQQLRAEAAEQRRHE